MLVNCCACKASKSEGERLKYKLKDGTFPAGSYVIKRDQPYGRLAKTLLEKQTYPDPVTRTYDDASWTMGMMSQTEVKEITDKAVLDLAGDAGDEPTSSWPARSPAADRCSPSRTTARTT